MDPNGKLTGIHVFNMFPKDLNLTKYEQYPNIHDIPTPPTQVRQNMHFVEASEVTCRGRGGVPSAPCF